MASIWMYLEGESGQILEWTRNKGQSKEFGPCRWSHHPLRQTLWECARRIVWRLGAELHM